MIILLGAVDAGLDALFFGVPAERLDAVRTPVGSPRTDGSSGSSPSGTRRPGWADRPRRRRRRPIAEALHVGRFGASGEGPHGG